MGTREIVHEETFPTSPGELLAILPTPGAIRRWWGAARAIVLPGPGGFWVATWGEQEDDPDYITFAKIEEFEPRRRMVLSDYRYHAKSGPLPFQAEFITEFLVVAHTEGAAPRVTQNSFPSDPEADEFYAGCQKGWEDTLAGIRTYLAGRTGGA